MFRYNISNNRSFYKYNMFFWCHIQTSLYYQNSEVTRKKGGKPYAGSCSYLRATYIRQIDEQYRIGGRLNVHIVL